MSAAGRHLRRPIPPDVAGAWRVLRGERAEGRP